MSHWLSNEAQGDQETLGLVRIGGYSNSLLDKGCAGATWRFRRWLGKSVAWPRPGDFPHAIKQRSAASRRFG